MIGASEDLHDGSTDDLRNRGSFAVCLVGHDGCQLVGEGYRDALHTAYVSAAAAVGNPCRGQPPAIQSPGSRMRRVLVVGIGILALSSVALAGRPSKRPSDDERGKELYTRHCLSCHGPTGGGDGPAAAAMVGGVPDLRGKIAGDRLDTQVTLVLDGKARMPSYENSFDKYDAKRLLNWWAKQTGPDADPPPVAKPPANPVDTDKPRDDTDR